MKTKTKKGEPGKVEIQKRFDIYEEAFEYASDLAKRTGRTIDLITSIDGYRTEKAKQAFYVQNYHDMVRVWEKVEHISFKKGITTKRTKIS